MRLLILGSTGLLGSNLTKYFLENSNFETFSFLRDSSKINLFKEKNHQNFVIIKDILDLIKLKEKIKILEPDIIINCLGITNKISEKNVSNESKFIKINSLFPHDLYRICMEFNIRLIHFSSDCVFSGYRGFYNENDNPDPLDIYGRSKLLGELNNKKCITIRKSIIGHEAFSKKGLLEWFLSQNNIVQGYKNVFFSGLTVMELARVIEMYIIPNKSLEGVFHVTGDSISKYDLLKIIADIYKKSIEIIPNDSIRINRTLDGSKFNQLTGFKTSSWPMLIQSMYEFNLLKK